MQQEARLEQIARARRVLTDPATARTTTACQPSHGQAWLQQSWQRCLARGQRPEHAVGFDLVPPGAYAHAEEAHAALLHAARPEMERLARAVAPIRYFAILTDAEGCVVETAGAIDRSDRRADAIARVGVDLSERSIGTSAIGAALGERHPVWLHRGEHFFNDTSVYSCAGAPLLGPTGECVGMLDLTGIDAPERPELKHLVARSARAVEDALVLAVPHALALRLGWADALPSEATDAVLCLNADGAVVSANATARQMLPLLDALPRTSVHADELFALPWGSLFDADRRDEPLQVPLWSSLRVAMHARRPHSAAASHVREAHQPLKVLEDELIRQAVRQAGGNVNQAAAALGLSRATVYRRLSAGRRPIGDGER